LSEVPVVKDKDRIGRRALLRGAGPATAATLLASSSAGQGRNGTTYAPTFFTASEWAFINAAVNRLIPPGGDGPGGVEAGVPEFIDRQLELPYGRGAYFYVSGPFQPNAPAELGYQLRHTPRELYRLGIAAIDAACKQQGDKTFAELDGSRQDAFLTLLETGKSGIAGPVPGAFFAQLLANTKEGYFADPMYGGNRDMAAWRMIGFPGARADFTDWIDRAGQPYPFGPVSVNGARSK
jgi:gluconate 2-dehydrogenase gamma chain